MRDSREALRWSVAVLAFGLCRCAGGQPVATPAAPEALRADQLAVTDQSLTSYTIETRLTLTNATETAMVVSGASYDLTLDGKPVGAGQVGIDQTVEPGQTASLRVPASVEVIHGADELQLFLSRGTTPIPVLFRGTLHVVQGAKAQDLAFTRTGEVRAPRLPVAKMNDAAVGRYGEGELGVAFFLGLENQNAFELKVKSITWSARLDGQDIGSGTASTGDRLPPSETAEYEIEATLKVIDRGRDSLPYELTGSVDLGILKMPINLTGTLNFSKKRQEHQAPKKRHAHGE